MSGNCSAAACPLKVSRPWPTISQLGYRQWLAERVQPDGNRGLIHHVPGHDLNPGGGRAGSGPFTPSHPLFRTARHRAFDGMQRRNYREWRSRNLNDSRGYTMSDEFENSVLTECEQHKLMRVILFERPAMYQLVTHKLMLEEIPQQEVARQLRRTTRCVRRYMDKALLYCALRLNGVPEQKPRNKTKL